MKTIYGRFIAAFAAALAVLLLATFAWAGPGHGKLKSDAKAAFEKTEDTAQDLVAQGKSVAKNGADKAGSVATMMATKVKAGVRTAGDVVSHVADKVKEKADALTK
jgi:hypothetical protein